MFYLYEQLTSEQGQLYFYHIINCRKKDLTPAVSVLPFILKQLYEDLQLVQVAKSSSFAEWTSKKSPLTLCVQTIPLHTFW